MSSLTEVDSKTSIPERKAGETFSPARHLSLEDTTQTLWLLGLGQMPHGEFGNLWLFFFFFLGQPSEIRVGEEDGGPPSPILEL